VAVLATKTRAVWLSFAVSVLLLWFVSSAPRLRRACFALALTGAFALLATVSCATVGCTLETRLQERSPVDFRIAVYQAGWEMFLERPLLGWGANEMQAELSRRISDFHQDAFYFHNTYLEILTEHGLVGLSLYVWIVIGLFRLKRSAHAPNESFLDTHFRTMWPVLLLAYFLNACFVVMNYQFVNGFLFAVAGMLAAQNQRAHALVHD
jgi:O-antigen ligase